MSQRLPNVEPTLALTSANVWRHPWAKVVPSAREAKLEPKRQITIALFTPGVLTKHRTPKIKPARVYIVLPFHSFWRRSGIYNI